MAAAKVKPLGDRVLVQPIEEGEVKKGGIIIPDTAKEKPQGAKSSLLAPVRSTTTARRSTSPLKLETKC